MSATNKSDGDEKEPVVIDRAFIHAQVSNAAAQFFRPLTVVFEKVGPNTYVARVPKEDRH